jgi:hypothetical protein
MKTSNMLVQMECKITDICNKTINKINCDTLTFGKYKGQSIYDIARNGEGRHYLRWVISDKCKVYNKVDYSTYLFND